MGLGPSRKIQATGNGGLPENWEALFISRRSKKIEM
jgi:hypothetical protein